MAKNTGEDVSQLVQHDQLDQELQPHLAPGSNTDHQYVSPEYINPALVDDDGVNQNESKSVSQNGSSSLGNVDGTGDNGHVAGSNLDRYGGSLNASTPVVYSASSGDGNVINQPVVIRQPNGVHVIRTRNCCDHIHDPNRIRHREKPLTLKKIKLLKAFSIASVFIFFPLGIPAIYYAFKCEKEFHAGILRGEIDVAKKLAKRSERCIIFAVMGALLVAVAVFAIIERSLMENDEEYWKNRSANRVLPGGR